MPAPIPITEPYLPPIDEYICHLKGIWERGHLTNHGPLVGQLESLIQTAQGLNTPVHCVANGALGLQVLCKAMGILGEIIITPFSYIATASCPLWEGCSVKYADIDPDSLTIDPTAVEAAITPATQAILATHVYGNPCDCDALEAIASKHGLALIFDAAHAYGVKFQNHSLLARGDASMVSMHATKLFHSVEGGFVVARDPDVSTRVEWMRRFGHDGESQYHGIGINAKMSELHAAMGLCVHRHLHEILKNRHSVCRVYDAALKDLPTLRRAFSLRGQTEWNAAYYPVRFDSEESLLKALAHMRKENIWCRRYFYPALHEALGHPASCPIAEKASREILCLPLSASVNQETSKRVIHTLRQSLYS